MRREENNRSRGKRSPEGKEKRATRSKNYNNAENDSEKGGYKKKWDPDKKDDRKQSDRPYKKRSEGFKGKDNRGGWDKSKSFKRDDNRRDDSKKENKYEDKKGMEVSFEDFLEEKRRKNKKEVLTLDRSKQDFKDEKNRKPRAEDNAIRLNRFIANAGICSRREADKLIAAGRIKVNGRAATEMGIHVTTSDVIEYDHQILQSEKKVYVLLNKPKDFISTVDDPENRKTIMALVEHTGDERIYPVGRLDRNTTGILLLTNDGELTKKLTHPKHNIQKIYEVFLNKPLDKQDFEKVKEGLNLDDGFIKVDEIEYIDSNDKSKIGMRLHSGRNRIVRRIFESLDYRVSRLDRVSFAGLTKKNVPRGEWRFLTEKEVGFLNML